MLKIVADSCCDLSPGQVSKYGITIVPLSVQLGLKSYLDNGQDVTREMIYEHVRQTGELPKTSAPSIGQFVEIFSEPGEYIYVGISAQFSSSLHDARLAAEHCPDSKVYFVDSKNLSTGIGHVVLRAAELRDQGLSAAKVVEELEQFREHVHSAFIIDTLDYLYKGGRCSSVAHLMGSMLRIRPVIEVTPEGKMDVREKTRGARKKGLDALLRDYEEHLDEVNPQRVFLTHTGCEGDAVYLCEEIKKLNAPQELVVTDAGCVITSHCGPNTIGILYCVN